MYNQACRRYDLLFSKKGEPCGKKSDERSRDGFDSGELEHSFPRLYILFFQNSSTGDWCHTNLFRSPPFGASSRTPRRRLNFALCRRAAVTSVLDDLSAAQESPTAAAASAMGTLGNVPVGANDGVDEALYGC